jgi:PAS domain S-box-containing protein
LSGLNFKLGERKQSISVLPGTRTFIAKLGVKSTSKLIIGGIALCMAEAVLIFGLLWQRARRRKAEVVLRESEERFRLVANSAPVLIWISGPDKLCIYFNKPWLDFTRRSVEAEFGYGWTEALHVDDLQKCLRAYAQAFDLRERYHMEYRLRRRDGEYRSIVSISVPRFNADDSNISQMQPSKLELASTK